MVKGIVMMLIDGCLGIGELYYALTADQKFTGGLAIGLDHSG